MLLSSLFLKYPSCKYKPFLKLYMFHNRALRNTVTSGGFIYALCAIIVHSLYSCVTH